MSNYKTVPNTCLRCGHSWIDGPGQHAECYHTGCPECGSLYWRINASDDYEVVVDGEFFVDDLTGVKA